MAWKGLPETVSITVETPQAAPVDLDPAKTAIVVVDMQNQFCKRGNERSFNVIEGNVRLLEKARETGAKVIFVQSVRQMESPEHTVYGKPLHLLVGTWESQIVDELTPQPGEPVVQKWSHDPFSWHGMEETLTKEGIIAGDWTVLVTGVSAATCAHATALGFMNRHYRTIIPMDCTAASVEAEARTYAQYMSPAYNYYTGFTLSSMVNFVPQAVEEPILVSV